VDNKTMIGPTAIPAFWRENYSGLANFNLKEFADIITLESILFLNNHFGFRSLALREIRKYAKKELVKTAGTLLNEINFTDFTKWGRTGIRAQLIDTKNKKLEMDFKFEGDDKSFHVLNAVSPAFTCAIPFSKLVVDNIKSKLSNT
jgi:L-2-hydroxyglutarate oxidase LhgO